MRDVGWEQRPLGSICDINPEAIGPQGIVGSFRYVDLSSVDVGRVDWDNLADLTLASAPSRARRVTRPGDVLFGTVRPALQSHAIVPAHAPFPLVASTGFCVLRARPGLSDPRFLGHLVFSTNVAAHARRRECGSGYPAVSERDLGTLTLALPPLHEQSAIAAVLDSFDDAIRKTEKIIAKLQQLYQGLLHDLLTRGIDEHGGLRDPERHRERFKDSPMGRIPKEWEVRRLGDIASHVGSGVTPHGGSATYPSYGVLFIRSQNVYFDGLHLDDVAYISGATHAAMSRSAILANDVLLNITGASIGRCCAVPSDLGPANVNQHVCAIRLTPASSDDAFFLSSLLASSFGQRQVDCLNAGSNRQGLNYEQIRAFRVQWPTPAERKAVAAVLRAQQAQIRAEANVLEALHALAAGLASDLLTGLTRTTSLGEATT